jgi:hypothetical protein
VCALALLARVAGAGIVELAPSADNTLYESETGALSNGKGWHCFSGQTGTLARRRALLRFDIAAALPTGATIHAVALRLTLSKTQVTVPSDSGWHRVLTAWGEGASDAPEDEGTGQFAAPGDATWLHTFHPSSTWTSAGGDFAALPSATLPLGAAGTYTWGSNAQFVSDVQGWLDAPSTAHGWILIGSELGVVSAKRFNTREHPDPATRPLLRIEYTLPGECGTSVPAQQVARAGSPANPLALLPGPTPPALGATWDPRVEHASFLPGAILDVLAVAGASANVPTALGTLLIVLTPPPLIATRSAGAPFALYVPADCALAGATLFAQAASIDVAGVIAVANALDLVVGAR